MIAIKEELLLWFISFFYKNSKGSGFNTEVKHNEHLAKELHQPITKIF